MYTILFWNISPPSTFFIPPSCLFSLCHRRWEVPPFPWIESKYNEFLGWRQPVGEMKRVLGGL